MKGFKNVNVYLPNQGIVKNSIGVEDGKISAIGKELNVENYCDVQENWIVVPGFIDQHIHGAMSSDSMDGSYKDIENIALGLAKEGTTSFLPTTMTQSPENIRQALVSIKEYMDAKPNVGARALGVHLEGPFISLKFIGAQPEEFVAKPSIQVFKEYQEVSGDNIRIVTLAPEEEGSSELIQYLKANNIVASVGHTNATSEDIEKAIELGLSNVTHTYNAQRPLHHREIGVVGSALLYDELNCELICDTIHVSVPAIKLVIKNKPHDKVTLVTDSMRAKHMADGDYELGGQPVYVRNGEARLSNGTLAGSVLKMNHAVRNVHKLAGIPLTDVLDFATINPAKNIGVDKERGSIEVGKYADLVVLDENFEVVMTIVEGNVVFKK